MFPYTSICIVLQLNEKQKSVNSNIKCKKKPIN